MKIEIPNLEVVTKEELESLKDLLENNHWYHNLVNCEGQLDIGDKVIFGDGAKGLIIDSDCIESEDTFNDGLHALLLSHYSDGDEWFVIDGGSYLQDLKEGRFKIIEENDE